MRKALMVAIIFICFSLPVQAISTDAVIVADGYRYDLKQEGEVVYAVKDGKKCAKIWTLSDEEFEHYYTEPYKLRCSDDTRQDDVPDFWRTDDPDYVFHIEKLDTELNIVERVGKVYMRGPSHVAVVALDDNVVTMQDGSLTLVRYISPEAIHMKFESLNEVIPESSESISENNESVSEEENFISGKTAIKGIDNPLYAFTSIYLCVYMMIIASRRRKNDPNILRKSYPVITGLTAILTMVMLYMKAPNPILGMLWAMLILNGGLLLNWLNKHPRLDPYIETASEADAKMAYMERMVPATNYEPSEDDTKVFWAMNIIAIVFIVRYWCLSMDWLPKTMYSDFEEVAAFIFINAWTLLMFLQMFIQTVRRTAR